jgi:hypothetical protein
MGLDLADVIEDVRLELDQVGPDIFTDLCNLIIPAATVPDDFGGETQGEPTTYRDIPCRIDPLGRSDREIGGAQITTQGHKITMGANARTKLIQPHYQIMVQGHHGMPEQLFENPVALTGSMDVFMKVAATKVR